MWDARPIMFNATNKWNAKYLHLVTESLTYSRQSQVANVIRIALQRDVSLIT